MDCLLSWSAVTSACGSCHAYCIFYRCLSPVDTMAVVVNSSTVVHVFYVQCQLWCHIIFAVELSHGEDGDLIVG